jgi:hypothetical protein
MNCDPDKLLKTNGKKCSGWVYGNKGAILFSLLVYDIKEVRRFFAWPVRVENRGNRRLCARRNWEDSTGSRIQPALADESEVSMIWPIKPGASSAGTFAWLGVRREILFQSRQD